MSEAASEVSEITINGLNYKFGKMDPRTQFHVTRRLSPIIGSIIAHVKDKGAINPDEVSAEDLKSLTPMIEAIAGLDDAAVDYILDKTLAVVEVQRGDRWAKVATREGALMFEDIDMPTMLQLAWRAIQANIAGFSKGSR